MIYFSKKDIVEMAKTEIFFNSKYTDDTIENKLNNLIDFLNASTILKESNFASEFLNLDQSKPKNPYEPYRFNLSTYIFLCLLLEIFDDKYFYNIYKGKSRSYEKADLLMRFLENSILKYRYVWKSNKCHFYKTSTVKWRVFALNMMSNIYKIITTDSKSKKVKEVDREIIKIAISLLSLPDNLKVEAYENSKNRLNYINEKIISKIVKKMESDTIYKIDKEMLEEKFKKYL
jgi:hypothetical protein